MKEFVIVDIDGTISKVGERLKYLQQEPKDWDSFYNDCFEDEPILEVISIVQYLYDCNKKIVFCTGRRESCREKTSEWIKHYFSHSFWRDYILLMRDDGDHRHDTEVKPKLLESFQITSDDVFLILEDRNSMVKKWRELGFTCLQPFDGEF